MDTSIGVRRDVKHALARAKPPLMPWSDYLLVLIDSIDRDRLREHLDRSIKAQEAAELELAVARVHALRRSPEARLSLNDARMRLQRQRLARQAQRLASALAEGTPWERLRPEAEALDRALHAALGP